MRYNTIQTNLLYKHMKKEYNDLIWILSRKLGLASLIPIQIITIYSKSCNLPYWF